MNKHHIDRDVVMNKKEFYRLPKKDQKALMASWRLVFSTEHIKKELGLSTTAFYSLLKRLELPTNLKAHRDAQPSLLNDNIEVTKIDSNPPISPSNEIKVEVSVIGRVEIDELPSVLEFAKEHNLELTLK